MAQIHILKIETFKREKFQVTYFEAKLADLIAPVVARETESEAVQALLEMFPHLFVSGKALIIKIERISEKPERSPRWNL